jgi:hypothetical protein
MVKRILESMDTDINKLKLLIALDMERATGDLEACEKRLEKLRTGFTILWDFVLQVSETCTVGNAAMIIADANKTLRLAVGYTT